MKTIGQILKEARIDKQYSLEYVEKMTKIKQSFIKNLEKEKWDSLPSFPTTLGFVKSISSLVGINVNTASATLKRDFPPKKLPINPKPDISSKRLGFGPRTAFFAGVLFVVTLVFAYLGFQYKKFISPPKLLVESPKDGQLVEKNNVLVFGSTDRDARITVNNQPVLIDMEGKFSVTIEVISETKEISVKATSRSGKEREVKRTINVED